MSTYYTSKYNGEEIDERLDSVSVVAAELAELSSQLSNKVAQLGKLSPELFDNPTHPNGYFASVDDRESPMPNSPAAGHWRLLYLPYFAATEGWAAQIAVGAVENSGLCWRKARGPEWQTWEFAATTTPPQEFDLPLAEGVSAVSSAYWKDQFGVVTGHFNVLASSSQTGSSPMIATLPEGFRPSRQANATAVVSSGESLGLFVLATGEIQLQDAASVTLEGKYIKGLFSFVAAS